MAGLHADFSPVSGSRPRNRASSQDKLAPQRLRRAAMIGNFPPRMCGIATFTRDLAAGLSLADPSIAWTIVAMSDRPEGYAFDKTVDVTVRQHDPDDYPMAVEAINRSGAEATFLQHEFGIFGGPAGEHILA